MSELFDEEESEPIAYGVGGGGGISIESSKNNESLKKRPAQRLCKRKDVRFIQIIIL
jgi:hypothetical protein